MNTNEIEKFNVFIASKNGLAVITALNNVLGIIWNRHSWKGQHEEGLSRE